MSHRRTPQQGAGRRCSPTQDLYTLIDEHLAWQLSHAQQHHRPTSSGTMFVDWAGTGAPKVTYRNVREDAPLPPPAHAQPRPSQQEKPISCHDSVGELMRRTGAMKAGQKYEGKGKGKGKAPQILVDASLHVTCRPTRPFGAVSVVDGERYAMPLEVRKRDRVVTFVKDVLGKLDELVLTLKLREERAARKTEGRWVAEGYVT